MHFFTKIKPWIAGSLLVGSSVFAEGSSCGGSQVTPVVKTSPMTPAYNASSRIEVKKSWDLFTTGSFIYWQPIQENMELGIISRSSNSEYALNGKVVDLDFEYKPGFKFAVGMNFDRDQWDGSVEYTWFRGHHHKHKTLNPSDANQKILPSRGVPDFAQPQYFSAKENWNLELDILDAGLARSSYQGKNLVMRPFFGLRTAFIRQYLKTSYIHETSGLLDSANVYVFDKSHSWGIGPKAGVAADWILGSGFSVYGNGAYDLLFTQYTDLSLNQYGTNSSGAIVRGSRYFVSQEDANYLRSHVELEIGLSYGSYFAQDKWHVDFSAGYGFQVFFNQNMFRNFIDDQSLGSSISPNGDLFIQGLNLKMRFDF